MCVVKFCSNKILPLLAGLPANTDWPVDVEDFAVALLLRLSSEVLVSAVWKVFSAWVNCSGLSGTFRLSGGSLFYWFSLDIEKLSWPNLSVLARGTTRSPWSAERSRGRCTSALTELQISCKYISADPLTQLWTSIQIVMRWRTVNQCSVSRMAVVIRPNLGMFSISRAEEFCIDCRRQMTDDLQPNRAELQ